MKYLVAASCEREDIYSLLPCEKIRTMIDAGAYNGDTAREAKGYFPYLERIYAVEPDTKNFKKLLKYSEAESEKTHTILFKYLYDAFKKAYIVSVQNDIRLFIIFWLFRRCFFTAAPGNTAFYLAGLVGTVCTLQHFV